MHIYYRVMMNYVDESPIKEMESIQDVAMEGENEEGETFSWSFSILSDEHNEIRTVQKSYNLKDDSFFNSMIRSAVDDYKHISRFDHFKWIIESRSDDELVFILSFWDESMELNRFKENLEWLLTLNHVRIVDLKFLEIDSHEYFDSHKKSMGEGSLECSTAWLDPAGRFEYIHELYEKDEDE